MRAIACCFLLATSLLLIGCGSNSNSTNSFGTAGPPTAAPPPSSPTPTSGGSPSTAPDSYLAQIYVSVGKNPFVQGQVTIDTTANNGQGNLQLTNVGAMENLELQFCSYPNGDTNCMNIAPVTTDASGNANMNFTFPQKGAFAGVFQLTLNGEQFAASATGSSGTSFKSALLPAGTITGGINQATGHAAGIGAVSVTGTTAHVTLNGTTPNHTFNASLCSQAFSTPCSTLADVTTDAQGNASVDVGSVQAAGWSTFRLSDADGVEFVSGFRVQ